MCHLIILMDLPGCFALGRSFIPIVCTTVGAVGPRSFLAFVRRIFDDAAAREILDGGRGLLTRYRQLVFYASVHAALARATAAMLRDRLSGPVAPGPRAGPSRAAASSPDAPPPDAIAADAADRNPDDHADYASDGADSQLSPPVDADAEVYADLSAASEEEPDP